MTPVIAGDAELATKLDALPEAIRAVLVAESDRLGRARQRFRPRSARAFVLRTAGVPPAIRAAIEAAPQQALHQ